MSWVFSNDREHNLKLVLTGDDDSGYPAWNGKRIEGTFLGVMMAVVDLIGYVSRKDSCDSSDPGLSPKVGADLAKLIEFGLSIPKLTFRIAFPSARGSRSRVRHCRSMYPAHPS